MRGWQKLVRFLTTGPSGYLADGRPIGLGLATALDANRDERRRAEAATASGAEKFLRQRVGDDHITTYR